MWFFQRTKLNLKICLISFARYREHFSFGCLQAILSLPAQIYAMSSTSEAKSREVQGGEEKVSEIQYWFAFETWNFSCYSNTRQRLKLIRLQGVSERLQDEGNGKINRSSKSYKIPLSYQELKNMENVARKCKLNVYEFHTPSPQRAENCSETNFSSAIFWETRWIRGAEAQNSSRSNLIFEHTATNPILQTISFMFKLLLHNSLSFTLLESNVVLVFSNILGAIFCGLNEAERVLFIWERGLLWHVHECWAWLIS